MPWHEGRAFFHEEIMKRFVRTLAFASVSFLGSLASAVAAELIVNVSTGPTLNATSGTTWSVDARSCTGCTSSTTLSIPKNSTALNTATSTSGATEMTYKFGYYNYFGTSWQKKGCNFTITVALDGAGNVVGISNYLATKMTGNSTCSGPQPSVDSGFVTWNVYVNAS